MEVIQNMWYVKKQNKTKQNKNLKIDRNQLFFNQ